MVSEQSALASYGAHAFTVLLDVEPEVAWGRVARRRSAARSGRGGVPLALSRAGSRSTTRLLTPARATSTARCWPRRAIHVEPGAIERPCRADPRERAARARRRRARRRDPRGAGAAGARSARHRRARGSRGRACEERRHARAALVGAPDRSRRCARRARRWLHHGRRRASPPRPTCAACRGSPCRRRSSGQVDAAIGGKTAIDLPGGKNLVGAFHWPAAGGLRSDAARDAAGGRAPQRARRGREDRAARGRAALGAPGARAGASLCGRSRRRSAWPTRTTVACARSSTSGTRSLTRSRRQPGTRFRTGARWPSGCSPRCGSAGSTTKPRPSSACSLPSRLRSTARPPGRRSHRDKKSAGGRAAARAPRCARTPRWGVELPDADVRAALDALIA